MTAADLADRWQCSAGWLANMRAAGSGPTYLKLGSRVLYPLGAVEAYEGARLVAAA